MHFGSNFADPKFTRYLLVHQTCRDQAKHLLLVFKRDKLSSLRYAPTRLVVTQKAALDLRIDFV
jgi:hypothetical protein